MDLAKVISFVEDALHEQGLSFAKLDSIILEAAWEDATYTEISEKYGANLNTIKGQAAPQLWKKLGQVFGLEIGKKSFRQTITAVIAEGSFDQSTEIVPTLPDTVLTATGATLPDTSGFVGRVEELSRLFKLVSSYPLLSVVGPEGIGKRTLVSKLIESRHSLSCENILWKPLHHRPTPEVLEEELLAAMGMNKDAELLTHLQLHPTLVILDAITQGVGVQALSSGHISLIRRVTEETPSKVIIISTQPIEELEDLVLRGKAMSYPLRGLKPTEAKFLLHSRWHGVAEELCRAVGGNPLLLKKIDGWSDYAGDIDNINRLTVLDELVGSFYNNILDGTGLSAIELALLKDIAEAKQGISFADLLSNRPESKAPIIRRLLDMGLAYRSNKESSIRLDPLFGRKLLGAG